MSVTQPKILLVDDRPENLLVLEDQLEGFALELLKATSGRETLKLALRHELALILLDVQMPEMDGFETAKMLRSVEKTRYVPIIFVTAIDQTRNRIAQGYEAGAVDFLFKPIFPHGLRGQEKP